MQTLLLPVSFALKRVDVHKDVRHTLLSLWFGAAGTCVQDSKYNVGVPAVVSEETGLSDRGFVSLF